MRDRQREETRRRLYLAALDVFRRDGVYGCRIDDIAQKAEVSRAAFYFHFPTKEHVLLDLLVENEQPQVKTLNELPANASLDQVLTTCVEAMAAAWQKEPLLIVDAMTVSIRNTAALEDRESGLVRQAVGVKFKELAARGELSSVLAPEMLSDFFLSECFVGLMSWGRAPQTSSLEAILKSTMQLFLQGARPQKPAAAPAKK